MSSSWTLQPIKSLVLWMSRGAHPKYAEDTSFWVVNQGAISGYQLSPDRMRECEPIFGHKGRFMAGDLLVASTGEGVLGKCALPSVAGYCDSHVSIVRCRSRDDAEFLYWWLAGNYETVNSLCALGSTKQTELQRAAFLSHRIAMPDRRGRVAISKFLRSECRILDARAEALVDKRRILNELKSSVREEFCFGRLSVESRAISEVAWHGELPVRWPVERLGNLFHERAELGYSNLPVLSVSIHSGISDKELGDHEAARKVSRSEDKGVYKRVLPGDVVYNQMRAWQGAFGVAKVEGLVSPAYVVARPRKKTSPNYVEHLLRTPRAIEEMRRRSRGIIDFRLRLYWDEFKDIVVPLPPYSEQIDIAAQIDARIKIIDDQIALIDEMASAILAQRQALIFDAISGRGGSDAVVAKDGGVMSALAV